jgi:TolB-like protein
MERGGRLLISPKIPTPEILSQLEKVLASRAFRHASRLSRFLRYTAEYALNGHTVKCKEFVLGMEVFDKPPTFDPRIDSIVRVEACRLRSRLKIYYESEGQADRVVIEYPKGGYLPTFRLAQPGKARAEESGADASGENPWKSIAVLPFSDLSPGTDQGYLTDGLADEIICVLTHERALRVVSQTSAFQYKGKALDIRQIGRELHADAVLEGSVRKEGPILRITAQLVDVRSGYIQWSGTYERLLEDIFAVQKDVSKAITAALRAQLRTAAAARPPE